MSRIMTCVQFAKKNIGSKAMSDGEAMSGGDVNKTRGCLTFTSPFNIFLQAFIQKLTANICAIPVPIVVLKLRSPISPTKFQIN